MSARNEGVLASPTLPGEEPVRVAPIARVSLRIDDVVRATGLGKRTVERLIRSGELHSFTVGTARLVRMADLEDFLARKVREEDWNY